MQKSFHHTAFTIRTVSIGLVLGLTAWVTDAFWSSFVSHKGSFALQFLSPASPDLAVRSLTTLIFIGLGIHSSALFERVRSSEQQQRESDERYHDLFENANDLIQSVSPDGRFLYVNRAWRDALGYTPEEVGRLTMLDITHPGSQAHCMRTFQRILAGEKIETFAATFITGTANRSWWRAA